MRRDAGRGGTGGGAGGAVDAGESFPIDLSQWEGVVSADDVRFLREMAKASLGEAADLDGDGISEVTALRLEDGTTRWDFDVLNDDWPLMTAERLPSGKVTLAFRLNQTSQINAVHTYDGPVTTFEWNDNLRANWFSDRETQTADADAGVISVRHETRASASSLLAGRRGVHQFGDRGAGCPRGVLLMAALSGCAWWVPAPTTRCRDRMARWRGIQLQRGRQEADPARLLVRHAEGA